MAMDNMLLPICDFETKLYQFVNLHYYQIITKLLTTMNAE